MARKADTDKAQKANQDEQMAQIEQRAQKQFAKDKAAAQKAAEAVNGKWTWDAESNYYYNALHRYPVAPKHWACIGMHACSKVRQGMDPS